jgi:hypothetical protein
VLSQPETADLGRNRARVFGRGLRCGDDDNLDAGNGDESVEGGPIGLMEEGDIININVAELRLDLEVDEAVLAERRKKYQRPTPKYTRGALHKYAKLVGPASGGAVLD